MQDSSLAPFGCFRRKAFVLTSDPPRKWRNIHYNVPGDMEVYAECSNLGDGPHTTRDREGNTCLVVGYDAKYLYIRDEQTGDVFTPWGDPVPTRVFGRHCVFHPAYTEIRGMCGDVEITQTVFVPRSEACEIWKVEVTNRSGIVRHVSLFAYAMFQLTGTNSAGEAVWKDNSSRIVPDLGGVFITNRDRSVPGWKFNGFLVTTSPHFFAASGYRDHFTRASYSLSDPKILSGWNADGRPGVGPDCAGIVQVTLEIQPHATVRADFLLGRAGGEEEVGALRKRMAPAMVEASLADQISIEESRAGKFSVVTGFASCDALVNHFSKKQMVSYLINKSGFRDNLQNDMGVAMFDWPMARENLRRAISSQRVDGTIPHGFRPWNDTQYSDKPAWMLHCVPWCLKESGDMEFLDEPLPYSNSTLKEPVWQHMLRAMRFLVNDTGAHGLCDQHFADWNDGLEPSGTTGPRESVMVTQQLCLGLLEVAELARRRNEEDVAIECEEWHSHFTGRLNAVAWDGAWYGRTLCADGYVLGSDANPEGKIFMNTQSWAVLSQTAPPERARSAMDAVDRLIENEYGFAITEPAFTHFDERVGKFSASRPYYAENGGCYNHAAGFKLVADCMLGRAEQAWRTFLKVSPGSPWNPVSNSFAEPFSFTNCYSRMPEQPGLAMYPWRTGTASWMVMGLVEWILGARRHYDGLLIDPCLPNALPEVRLIRTFRGSRYSISIERRGGPRTITFDGTTVNSPILPPPDGQPHRVQVSL